MVHLKHLVTFYFQQASSSFVQASHITWFIEWTRCWSQKHLQKYLMNKIRFCCLFHLFYQFILKIYEMLTRISQQNEKTGNWWEISENMPSCTVLQSFIGWSFFISNKKRSYNNTLWAELASTYNNIQNWYSVLLKCMLTRYVWIPWFDYERPRKDTFSVTSLKKI